MFGRGDYGIFTIINAHCLAEGKSISNWAIQDRMPMHREYLTYHLWYHTMWKDYHDYESDIEKDDGWDDMDF